MARVTVEDCVDKVPNRFELVLLASHRARAISQGALLTVDRDNDKNPVVALREVAEETVDTDDLLEDLIHSMQQHVEVDEPEPDAVPMLTSGSSPVMMGKDDPRARLEDDVMVDRMTEEDLLRGIEGIGPGDPSGSRSGY